MAVAAASSIHEVLAEPGWQKNWQRDTSCLRLSSKGATIGISTLDVGRCNAVLLSSRTVCKLV